MSFIYCFLFNFSTALACSVCGAVSEQSRLAYLKTTLLLSLAPLAIIGGVVYYIYRVYSKENH